MTTSPANSNQQTRNEQILSQQLHQLSPFKKPDENIQQSNTDMLESVTMMNGMDFDFIPDYLCKTNPSLEKCISSILPSSVNLEDLRNIAILMHKMMSIELVHRLWIIYRQAGQGELQSNLVINPTTSNIKFWPKEVRSLVRQSTIQYLDEDDACLHFVNHCLHDLNNKNQQYRHELNLKTSRLYGYNRSLEYTIEKLIKKNLGSMRIQTDEQIALVQYHSTDQILQHTYLAQNPNETQIQLIQRLCKLKYNYEMAKYELDLLTQQISSHISSHPFEHESIAKSSVLDNIPDLTLRQQLYKQYKDVAEQGRNKMMTLYTETIERQMIEFHKQFDIGMEEMWKRQKTLSVELQLTETMLNLINQRLINITTYFKTLYKLKSE